MLSQQRKGALSMIPGTHPAEKYQAKLILHGRSPFTASVEGKPAGILNSGRIS